MEAVISQQNDGRIELELIDGTRISGESYRLLRITVMNVAGDFSTIFLDKYNVGRLLVDISNKIGDM